MLPFFRASSQPNVGARAPFDKRGAVHHLASGTLERLLVETLTLVLAALLIEALVGFPDWLFAKIRHPVVWIGALIARLDAAVNQDRASDGRRRTAGVVNLVFVLAAALVPCWILQAALIGWVWPLGLIVLAILASSLLAQRSLHSHVAAVAQGLDDGGLEEGRKAVAMIVGRDPASLDEPGVARAAIESLAENFSDGVVAPAFYCAVAGLPGMALYKAANTADSMIGHKTERHSAFGWAAARYDDVMNLPASRLSVLWILLAATLLTDCSVRGAWTSVRQDARKHRSPNAGWPEAAFAGALGLRLAGPRHYGAEVVEDAWMGGGRSDAGAADIRRALRLYRAAAAIQIGAIALLLLVLSLRG